MTNQQPPFGGGFPQPGSGNSGSGGSSVWGSGSSAGNSPWGSPGQSAPAPSSGGAQPTSPWGAPGSAGTGAGADSFGGPSTDPFAPASEGSYGGPRAGVGGGAGPLGSGGGTSGRARWWAPTTWLVPGLALGVVALVMTLILLLGNISPVSGTYAGMAFGAWALAGLLGVSSLAFYFSEDTRRRANGMYSIVGWKQGLYFATLAVLLIAIILSSLCIALWVGRL